MVKCHTREQVKGCIEGLAICDAMGAPFEGKQVINTLPLNHLLTAPPSLHRYTDKTEMAIGLTEALPEVLSSAGPAKGLTINVNISRGYSRGTIAVIDMLMEGDTDTIAAMTGAMARARAGYGALLEKAL